LSVLARFAGGGGGSEVDVRSSVECPISLSVVVALVLMDGVVHVRAVPSDLPAMWYAAIRTFMVVIVAVVVGVVVVVVVVLVAVVVIVVEVVVMVVVGGR
jgi:hypothetical protein